MEETTFPETKECPKCAETIKWDAVLCRYCGYEYSDEEIIAAKESTISVDERRRRKKKERQEYYDDMIIKQKAKSTRKLKFISFSLVLLFVGYCAFSPKNEESSLNQASKVESMSAVEQKVESMSAVEQMEWAFVGNPMQSEIISLIDPVMRMYGVPLSEKGYRGAGSALVVLRKEYGVSEMDILRCMKAANQGDKMKFPGIAAICVTTLK